MSDNTCAVENRNGEHPGSAEGLSPLDDRKTAVKLRVDEQRARVVRLNNALAEMNTRVSSEHAHWAKKASLKREYAAAIEDLRKVKAEMQVLCGVTGHDPRWTLVRDAWRGLTRLDEAGIDIGDDGQKALDDIEFHVPAAKLTGGA